MFRYATSIGEIWKNSYTLCSEDVKGNHLKCLGVCEIVISKWKAKNGGSESGVFGSV
jgi:hypothetical protein